MPYEEIAFYARPDDPVAFDLHYRTVHAPLVRKLPGLVEFSMMHPEASGAAGFDDVYMVVRVSFADRDAAERAMRTAVAAEIEADLANFAGAGMRAVVGTTEHLT
jgi:uncharacterized protein (TIGR02118 family)